MLDILYVKLNFKIEISFSSYDNAALAVLHRIKQLASIER